MKQLEQESALLAKKLLEAQSRFQGAEDAVDTLLEQQRCVVLLLTSPSLPRSPLPPPPLYMHIYILSHGPGLRFCLQAFGCSPWSYAALFMGSSQIAVAGLDGESFNHGVGRARWKRA